MNFLLHAMEGTCHRNDVLLEVEHFLNDLYSNSPLRFIVYS